GRRQRVDEVGRRVRLIDHELLRIGEVRPGCPGSRHVAARQQIADRLPVLGPVRAKDTVEGPVLTDQNDHVFDGSRCRRDLTTPHHARHVALQKDEARATRRVRVSGHVWSWGPPRTVGAVVDRAASPRQNDRGNERKEGSHRLPPSVSPFPCPSAIETTACLLTCFFIDASFQPKSGGYRPHVSPAWPRHEDRIKSRGLVVVPWVSRSAECSGRLSRKL